VQKFYNRFLVKKILRANEFKKIKFANKFTHRQNQYLAIDRNRCRRTGSFQLLPPPLALLFLYFYGITRIIKKVGQS
jgi:hypothetical protein